MPQPLQKDISSIMLKINAQLLTISFLRNNLNLDMKARRISAPIILINNFLNLRQGRNDIIQLTSMLWFRKYRVKMYVILALSHNNKIGSVCPKSSNYKSMSDPWVDSLLRVNNGKILAQAKAIQKSSNSIISQSSINHPSD